MSKPVCYMGTYNEHDIRDMHTVVVRYVTDFKSNPDRVIPLYEHPPVPTTERRVIPEDVRKVMEMVLREVEAVANDHHHPRYTRLDEAITALRNALNAAPKGEV